MPTDTPHEAATLIARKLRDHGHVAYFAGGCVRDRLLGIDPVDYDIATDARPERIKEIFRNAKSVGESFGVMLVRLDDFMIEVATFRSDGPYIDGRHPETVTFADEEADAARRDFTINAIFELPESGELVDHFDGERDLQDRILRAVGNPADRLAEDHLRLLRAVRFAARFQLEIEQGTEAAIRAAAGELAGVSHERIGGELRRMLADPSRARAVSLLESFGIDATIFQDEVDSPGGHPALSALGEEEREPIDGLAAWMLDRGGPIDQEAVNRLRGALLLSNREHRILGATLATVQDLENSWRELAVAGRKRLAVAEAFPVALELLRVRDELLANEVVRDVAELVTSGLAPEPFINGDMLIEEGLKPGPRFKEILDSVYDAQLEERVLDRAAALSLALEIANTNEGGSK